MLEQWMRLARKQCDEYLFLVSHRVLCPIAWPFCSNGLFMCDARRIRAAMAVLISGKEGDGGYFTCCGAASSVFQAPGAAMSWVQEKCVPHYFYETDILSTCSWGPFVRASNKPVIWKFVLVIRSVCVYVCVCVSVFMSVSVCVCVSVFRLFNFKLHWNLWVRSINFRSWRPWSFWC